MLVVVKLSSDIGESDKMRKENDELKAWIGAWRGVYNGGKWTAVAFLTLAIYPRGRQDFQLLLYMNNKMSQFLLL